MKKGHIAVTPTYTLISLGDEPPFLVAHSCVLPVSWRESDDGVTHAAWKRWERKHGGPRWVTRNAATRACKAFAAHIKQQQRIRAAEKP